MSKDRSFSILAGKYKGVKLHLLDLATTRSTKNIIRESFFNVVQNDIKGMNFIEVFGGSGSMGLEALSRGAKRAYFIEKNAQAYENLVQNCKKIDMSSCSVKKGDSFEIFPKILVTLKDEKNIFYFDPPFSFREGMDGIYENVISLIEKIPSAKEDIVAIEHMSSLDTPQVLGGFSKVKFKKFGKTSLSYYRFV